MHEPCASSRLQRAQDDDGSATGRSKTRWQVYVKMAVLVLKHSMALLTKTSVLSDEGRVESKCPAKGLLDRRVQAVCRKLDCTKIEGSLREADGASLSARTH